MTNELWGVGPDARRAARPVAVCSALGVAASALTFSAALLLGRGFSGSALAALLVPLALSGALAVGLAVAFMVAMAMEQPYGAARIRRIVPVVTPLAALVALFAYAADPAGNSGRPVTGAGPAPTVIVEPRGPVSVPSDDGTTTVLGTRTKAPKAQGQGGEPPAVVGPVAPPPAPAPAPRATPPVVVAPGGEVAVPDVLTPALRPRGERDLSGYTGTKKCAKAAKHGRAHCKSKRWKR